MYIHFNQRSSELAGTGEESQARLTESDETTSCFIKKFLFLLKLIFDYVNFDIQILS